MPPISLKDLAYFLKSCPFAGSTFSNLNRVLEEAWLERVNPRALEGTVLWGKRFLRIVENNAFLQPSETLGGISVVMQSMGPLCIYVGLIISSVLVRFS